MKKTIFIISLFIGAFCLGLYDAPSYVFGIFYAGVFLSFFWTIYYPFYFSKNLTSIERYLSKQSKKSILYFLYSVTNHMHDEIEQSYHYIMKKQMNPSKKAIYQVVYGFAKKDMQLVKERIDFIKVPEWNSYYKTLLYIEENELEKAKVTKASMRSQKFKNVLEFELLLKENKLEEAKTLLSHLISNSRGYHYYMLSKRYEETFKTKEIV
ncbi:hypothetical protein [Gottfriedia solisilvae]|uniref:Uncharacterized protein n=1 Tax=Gottfriedia solisilvae TaxID=1516104 RepID=A0A8J3ALQ1_9BACI|nr:hypothetical protein [Gottfriedia solisilvae]GGI13187.1 hypothetical protein GCM10007380_16660 [Gottfriedia solisilvae]